MLLDKNLDRRSFFATTIAAAISTMLPRASRAESTLLALSATQAVARMQTGDLKAEHYAAALLDRCESLARLNSFISLERERVLESARAADLRRAAGSQLGLLHGLPLAVKDSISTKDLPTTAGTPALRGFRPGRDADVVAAVHSAGAISLGKTNLHEMSFGYTSNNFGYGAVANPYDTRRVPGGSSGGTAAAIAARLCPLGLAADTGGSTRVPAALCGIAGLRPSLGRYPARGTVPLTARMDTVGPQARDMADIALFDRAVTGDTRPIGGAALKGTRIGVPRRYFWDNLEPGVERVAHEALRRLRDAGAVLVEADISDVGTLAPGAFFPIVLGETEATVDRYLQDHGATLTVRELVANASPNLKFAFENYVFPGGKFTPPPEAYRTAVEQMQPALKAAYRDYFAQHGVVATVFPAVPITAPFIGEDFEVSLNGKKLPTYLVLSRNALPGSVATLPGLVLPAGLDEKGLPVGLEFDSPAGEDRALIALGMAVEAVLGRIPGPAV